MNINKLSEKINEAILGAFGLNTMPEQGINYWYVQKYQDRAKTICPHCEGETLVKHKNKSFVCAHCFGTGKRTDYDSCASFKYRPVKRPLQTLYYSISLKQIELNCSYYEYGVFMNEAEAQARCEELNKNERKI